MANHSVGNNPIDPIGDPKLQTVDDPRGAHEQQDVNPKYLFIFLAALVVVVTIVMLLMILMFNFFENRVASIDPEASPLARQRQDFVGIKLEPSPTTEIDQMQEEQREIMTSYGWIDRRAGIVRVPLEEAMQSAAKNGLPEWQPIEEPAEPVTTDPTITDETTSDEGGTP